MAQFVEMEPDGNPLSKEEIMARLQRLENSVERTGLYGRFAERCDIANVKTAPSTLIVGSMAISAFGAVVLAAAWSSWFILLLPVGPVAVWYWVGRQARRQRKLFAEQLPDNLDVMAQSTRVGHSLVGALSAMAEGAAQPSRREFARVVTDEQLGIPLEDALRTIAIRMENRDMDHVALVALLQRETGGASAEVIDQVADNIRGRMEIRRLVNTLTAQGRLARWIVSLMPVVLILMILLIFPSYLDPLLHESFGIVILAICAVMICAGSYVIKRIVEIKV
jgi:tight adherence protein B